MECILQHRFGGFVMFFDAKMACSGDFTFVWMLQDLTLVVYLHAQAQANNTKPPVVLQLEPTAQSVISLTTRWQYIVYPKTLLPLQRCHLTYISKLTDRNERDTFLNGTECIRAAYLFIHWPSGRNTLPGSSVTYYRSWHAQPCHQSSTNIRTVGGREA